MPQDVPSSTAFTVSKLRQNTATDFSLRPDPARLAELAVALDLIGLRKLSFSGTLKAQGASDWRLDAKLGATVVQPCGITLEPVQTRIDVPVTRLYVHDYSEADEPETEMSGDDTVEPLGAVIDAAAVMVEALVLALPLYPRADGAELGQLVYTKPGDVPMTDEDARPFAGLAGLKGKLAGPEGDT